MTLVALLMVVSYLMLCAKMTRCISMPDAQSYLTLMFVLPSLSADVLTDDSARWLVQMGWPTSFSDDACFFKPLMGCEDDGWQALMDLCAFDDMMALKVLMYPGPDIDVYSRRWWSLDDSHGDGVLRDALEMVHHIF